MTSSAASQIPAPLAAAAAAALYIPCSAYGFMAPENIADLFTLHSDRPWQRECRTAIWHKVAEGPGVCLTVYLALVRLPRGCRVRTAAALPMQLEAAAVGRPVRILLAVISVLAARLVVSGRLAALAVMTGFHDDQIPFVFER